LAALYGPGHPYAVPIDGTESSVACLVQDDLIRFYPELLNPARAAIVVAGAVDPDEVAREFDTRLSGWKSDNVGSEVEIPVLDRPSHPRILLLNRKGAAQAVVRVGHVGLNRFSEDHDAMLLANQVLGGQFDSRLNRKLREEKGYTYGVRSRFDARRGAGPFSISASLETDRLADALNDLYREVMAFAGGRPPSVEELDKAKRALIEGQARQFETYADLVSRYANLLVYGLPIDHHRSFAARIEAIRPEEVSEAIQRQIHPDSLAVVVVADASLVQDPLSQLEWAEVTVLEG
jgi:predicted Zn-dependent peptidase